jgi:hypothetical protein
MAKLKSLGTFKGKIYTTSDKKKLKEKSKTYSYGTVSIRARKLSEYDGQDVIVKVYKKVETNGK